ncbi:hypothetical protein BKK79_30375 [Cupriavidus sp. USMAA2-4]|nr:hypothetical protein BKK79_30375 [Cupriavidus sp. USMAA2-4]
MVEAVSAAAPSMLELAGDLTREVSAFRLGLPPAGRVLAVAAPGWHRGDADRHVAPAAPSV